MTPHQARHPDQQTTLSARQSTIVGNKITKALPGVAIVIGSDTIRENTLRELVESSSIGSTSVVGQHGGFSVTVRCGKTQKVLGSTRGGVRLFPNLTSLATFLRGLGISRFEVDTAQYSPARVRPPRPDRTEALKRTRTKPHQPDLLR